MGAFHDEKGRDASSGLGAGPDDVMLVMPGPDRASHSASFLRTARYLSPETMDAVEGLIDDLGLEFFASEKVEEPPEEHNE